MLNDDSLTNSRREAAEAKKREAAAKKAEKEALLKAEEAALKTIKTNPKAGSKKEKAPLPKRGIDSAFASLDAPDSKAAPALHASGIDDALDALSIAHGTTEKIDRHPERRFKAAYAAYEERRLPDIKLEHPGLRQNQMKELIRKEFEKSEENPFNKANIVRYDATRDEVAEKRKQEREKTEKRLVGN